ncbi:MAG: SpoIIE family protein phosphatase [Naasia sp.]
MSETIRDAVGTARRAELDRLGLMDSPSTERLDRFTRMAREIFRVQDAQISLLDDTRLFVKSHVGAVARQGVEAPISAAFCSETIRADRTFVVEDSTTEASRSAYPAVHVDPGFPFYAGHPLTTGGQRIGALCIFDDKPRRLSSGEMQMLAELAQLVETELDAVVEVERASVVQRALLPRSVPDIAGYDLAGDCLATRGVSGDFYDWYPVENGLTLTLADVMGKGSGAAIIAATIRATLRAGARSADPVDAVESASDALVDDLDGAATFATLFHARLETASGELRFVDAGHGLTIIVREDGTSERLASDDLPLGIGVGARRTAATAVLGAGDALVSVSDGVLDLYDGALTTLDEVEAIVRRSVDSGAIVSALIDLARAADAPDDVTVLALRRTA